MVLKRRIRSVNNTLKTTRAMQMISSVKMRHSVESAESSRVFVREAQAVLQRLLLQGKVNHKLLNKRAVKSVLYLLITSDKGLAGSYNSDVLRLFMQEVAALKAENKKVSVISLGRKGSGFVAKMNDVNVVASFNDLGDSIEFVESVPIGKLILDEYTQQNCDQVKVIYKQFVSTLTQPVVSMGLIPVQPKIDEDLEATDFVLKGHYVFEPSSEEVLNAILPYLIQMNLFQSMLEASASEHAARMVAMKNATDAGSELVEDLTFTANKIRQEKITAEIAEIAAGAAAIE